LVFDTHFPRLAEFLGCFECHVFKKPRKSTHVRQKTIGSPNFFSTEIKFCEKVGGVFETVKIISFVSARNLVSFCQQPFRRNVR